ncbi:MAG: tetratricopeptide repeat protein [Planctomycetes bacterium]|nr:tetratricopeptide repeat protein [Planctomycetota bacterium]
MRTFAVIMMLLGAPAAWVRADDITLTTTRIPWRAVTITDFRDMRVCFTTDNGVKKEKPLGEIRQIAMSSSADFTKAEEMLAKGQYEQAVELYTKAGRQFDQPWQKKLSGYRRLAAVCNTVLIGTAADDWLAMAKESHYDRTVLDMVPAKADKKGSAQNAAAIKSLAAAQKTENRDFQRCIWTLLVTIHTAEGDGDKAAEYARKLVGEQADANALPINALRALLEGNKLDECIAAVYKGLKTDKYKDADLPEVFFILAQAQLARHARSSDQALLVEAGLNFMRVAVFYPSSRQAPEALFNAGQINRKLNNKAAARAAFQKIIETYTTDEAIIARAKEAIASLN